MLLGLAGGFLKSLGGKKKKKKTSGEEMANNITNKPKDKNLSITVREKQSIVKGADITPLKDIRDDMKQSSGKNKDPLNLALDGIDNSLFGIIDTLTETNAIRKKLKSEENKEEQLEKKNLRERMLEGASGLLKGSVKMVKRIGGKTLNNLINFLTWTLLGTLVNFIVENWKSIREQIEKVMEQLKEVFEKLKPILIGIKDIVMWLGTTGWNWIVRIKDVMDGTTPQKIKDIEKILKDDEMIEKAWKGNAKQLEKLFNELEKAETREEKSEVMRKYAPLFDTQRGKVPKLWRRMKGPGFQGQLVVLDPHFWQGLTGTGEVQYFKANPKDPRFKGELIGNEKDLIVWFHTDEGKKYLRDHDPDMLKLVEEGYYKNHEETKNLFETKNKDLNLIKDKDIQSYFVGIDDYSDDFEESSIILSSEGEGGSMNNGSKTPMFFGGSSGGLNIEDLYKIKINQ